MWTGKKKENLYTLRAYYLRASNYNGFANGFSKDSHNKSKYFWSLFLYMKELKFKNLKNDLSQRLRTSHGQVGSLIVV